LGGVEPIAQETIAVEFDESLEIEQRFDAQPAGKRESKIVWDGAGLG
jgi:hypothetical protein